MRTDRKPRRGSIRADLTLRQSAGISHRLRCHIASKRAQSGETDAWKPTKIRDAAIWFGLAISAALAFFFL